MMAPSKILTFITPYQISPLKCKCVKMLNVCGDFFFDCHFHSKMSLHNCTRDARFLSFHTVTPWCGFVGSADDALLEPTGMLKVHPRKRPADFALRLLEKPLLFLGVDFTIAGTPKPTTTQTQRLENMLNLRKKEFLKWRGTTKLNGTHADGSPQ